jgi:serine/threonine protein kinase
VAARLHHPNVARVTYYGEQDGECFYVMEFVEGETLEERVRREGPLAPTLALEIAVQTARALAAAESCGVIHRDLKPSNLMIASRQGESEISDSLLVKVIDFGIAKITGTGMEQTQAGFIGTPAYASPEQFTGSGGVQVDTRSDIYSLGITLWYLISGKTPFVGRTLEEIQEKQSDELPLEQLRMANVPDKMIGLVRSMLAVDPGDRPQSARELLDAIQRCRKEEADAPSMVEAALHREEGLWTAVLPFKFSGDPEMRDSLKADRRDRHRNGAISLSRVIARSLTRAISRVCCRSESWQRTAPATCWREACDKRETSFVSLCSWWIPTRERTFGPRPSIVSGKRRESSICRTKSPIASSARLPMCMACSLVRSPRPRP